MNIISPFIASYEKRIVKNNFLSNLYCFVYRQVVKREINLGFITDQDTVLNIGCGAVPYTAIYMAMLSGAKIWAVDRDREAAEKAGFLIKKLGLQNRVNIINEDGSKIIPVQFTAAVVALQAEPKKHILTNLLANSSTRTRFILREAKKIVQNQYDILPQEYQPVKRLTHIMLTFNSILLIK